MKPLKFKPIFMERIWGGTALRDKFGFDIPEGKKIGELWTISDNRTAVSVIEGGEFNGQKLSDIAYKFFEDIYGKGVNYERFPLLIKIIDAQDKLSVQVHPDDEYAFKYENGDSGKTEMWYIIDAKPGAKLVCGLKEGTTKEEFKRLLEEERLEECLKEIEVKPGDVVYIPSGMVHAIGEGILICEIQQNSDLTYRVYDYNRVDEFGRKRKLHIEKALDVIDFNLKTDKIIPEFKGIQGGRISHVVKSPYFQVSIIEINEEVKIDTEGKFNTLTAVEGNCKIDYYEGTVELKAGETVLIPASIPSYTIEGNCKVLKAYI
ncbi:MULTISPECIES: mannose-6-phosphate isomerase, class I [Thermoanaerobacter]|uniref:mannose-6-phosphate isomerase n=1 Tax=Thermoanaerobacter siderophilus SR4 TaxID=880478 RepID=I9KU32_9THEO|nr:MULTISPECIES: mannose-6-phosphate isomerase, class I [Thermoanaerobacter]EIW00464.1 phosphomannose isomerase [Thermoanaerobacter siderophilus SR4]UZQ82143.1 mannose-6-phosphate isomerase, class I [Thermoanaerobacter sp. RKWS2]HHY80277.1 mannose-6-phosphate isomerase, class I [Thermoanaerobacter sp.]